MSEQRPPLEPNEPAADGTPQPGAAPSPNGYRAVAIALAAALLLVFALVAAAPIWAPLLPWGSGEEVPVFADQIDRLEAAQAKAEQLQQQVQETAAETKSALQRLERRIGALEARPAPAAADVADVRQEMAKLAAHAGTIDRAMQAQSARLDAVEKAVQGQAARLQAVEQAAKAHSARDTSDAGLVIALLQIRGALEAGRPFPAEYEAFASLARGRPDLTAAAEPLAEPAKTGVASRAVLAQRLHELAGAIAGASARRPAVNGAASWSDEALAKLRGLVTIRRLDGAPPGSAAATVNSAERALAGGDLAGGIAALDKLTGAPAEAAGPWLRLARQRLSIETALRRIEALLTAGLGNPPAAPGSSG